MNAITTEGLVKIYRSRKMRGPRARRRRPRRSRRHDPGSARAERRRQDDDASGSWRRSCGPTPGTRRWPASTSSAAPRAPCGHRSVRPVRGRRREPDRAREPVDVRAAVPAAQGRGPAPRRRAPRTFELTDAGEPRRQDLLGRDAPPSRPGQRPDRSAADPVPRRADDRARPAQPARDVGRHPRPGPRGRDAAADDPVPRGGRRAGRRRSRSSTTGRSSPAARPTS